METGRFQNDGRLVALARAAGYDAEKLSVFYGLSPRQFRRVVEEELGCSPRKLLNGFKLARAQMDLPARRPIKQIASELGYNSVSNFCAWFKQTTGLSPTEYKKKARINTQC